MTDSSSAPYRVEQDGSVRIITITRQDQANTLSRDLSSGLTEEFVQAGNDPSVNVIVITAAGDRHFCAGADLKDVDRPEVATEMFRVTYGRTQRILFEVMAETYKPIIGALNGDAVGGGCEIALACDLLIAGEGIRIAMPEAKIGMGGTYGTVVLPRRLPLAIAFELLFTGDYLFAEDAARWGLVNRVVPRADVLPVAVELAQRIAKNAMLTIRRMKEIVLTGYELPIPMAVRLGVGPDPYNSYDRQEGIRAFVEKRPPNFEGR